MPPAVAPASQMRRAGTAVGPQHRRHLGDAQAADRRLHHHFAGEFHPRRLQIERQDGAAVEAAQAAVEIAARAAEEDAADRRQHGVAEVAVQLRHGAGHDAALEAVAHDQLVSRAKLRDEIVKPAEIVAVVGIAHDDVTAARGMDAAAQRAAVAAFGDRHERAPAASAIACEPSVLPLSAIRISPSTPLRSRYARAFRMQDARVSASLRQGIRMLSSHSAASTVWRGSAAGWMSSCSMQRPSRDPGDGHYADES